MGSQPHLTKKRSLSTSFLGAQWDSSASLQRLRRLRTLLGSHPTEHKKRPNESVFFRVPSGIRTHDIQNHNLTL